MSLLKPNRLSTVNLSGIDGSAALTLEEIMQRARDAGQDVLVVGMQFGVARMLGHIGALDGFKDTSRFAARLEALEAAASSVAARTSSTV